jgi:uncharacterized lipoprotein YajG
VHQTKRMRSYLFILLSILFIATANAQSPEHGNIKVSISNENAAVLENATVEL